MSTPTIISRYPRPLRATQTFQKQKQPQSLSSPHSSPLTSYSSSSSIRSSHKSAPSPETLSPSSSSHDLHKDTQFIMSEEFNRLSCSPSSMSHVPASIIMAPPRRASSLDSLNDDTIQVENDINGQQIEQVHKRSNSCSNADAIRKFHIRGYNKVEHHTRKSIEGINQEVSSVFEGKPNSHILSYPDGHIAPVHDSPSSNIPMSPQYEYISPLSSPLHSSVSPRSYIYSPKQSFAHTPPPNVEKCKIVHDRFLDNSVSPRPPDQTKANIVFNGTVFVPPLLPSHNLKAVPII